MDTYKDNKQYPSLPKGAKIVYVSDIIRHGARTPIVTIPGVKYPDIWHPDNVPNGQLTFTGFLQIKKIGENAKGFFTKYGILPDIDHLDSLQIRTTGVNRTIMSATAYLTGLYPQHFFNYPRNLTLNMHSQKKDQDNLLLQSDSLPDMNYKKALGWKKYWQDIAYSNYKRWYDINPSFFLVYNKDYKEHCLNSSDISPEKAHHCIMGITRLADNAIALDDYCSEASSNCKATDALGITDTDLAEIKAHFTWAHTRNVISYDTPESYEFHQYLNAYQHNANMRGSNIIREIIHRTDLASTDTSSVKLTLYSAHDKTILNVASYLLNNNPNQINAFQEFPYFGATLRVIVYRVSDELYTVVVYYPGFDAMKPTVIYGHEDKGTIKGKLYSEFKRRFS